MNKVIWKYNLTQYDRGMKMPKDAKVLTIQTQDNRVTMWALVDPSAPTELRFFRLFETGEPIPEDVFPLDYITTVTQEGMDIYVWHIFEQPRINE